MLLQGVDYVLYLVLLLSEVFYDLLDHYSLVYELWSIVDGIKLVEVFKFVQFSNDIIRLDHHANVVSLAQHILIQKLQIVRAD